MRIYISSKKERKKERKKQTNKMACAPREDSDQPYQSFRCSHEESLGPYLPRLIRVFAGRKDHFVVLVMRRLIYFKCTFAYNLKCSC